MRSPDNGRTGAPVVGRTPLQLLDRALLHAPLIVHVSGVVAVVATAMVAVAVVVVVVVVRVALIMWLMVMLALRMMRMWRWHVIGRRRRLVAGRGGWIGMRLEFGGQLLRKVFLVLVVLVCI